MATSAGGRATRDAAGRAIRRADAEDLRVIRPILVAHGNDGPVVTADIVGPYLLHLIDRHRALVLEEAGAVVAFGAVAFAGPITHLADLFVAPDRLGEGMGRALLAELFADATLRTTFASDDPRAVPSYVRAGMLPRWPLLYLRGDPAALPPDRDGLELVPATGSEVAALEASWTGVDRLDDHVHWAASPMGDTFLVRESGEAAAFAHARVRQPAPIRTVARAMVRPDVDPVAPLIAILRRAAAGGPLDVGIPGPSPLLPILLEARFRIEDRDTYMASEPDLIDPTRFVPNSGFL